MRTCLGRLAATHRPLPRGFTLIELMVALTLAAVLVTALATATQMFAMEIAYVRADQDRSAELALDTISGAVRQAWDATNPSTDELVVSDPYGNLTTFSLDGTDLVVERPSGATGTLLTGVAGLSFSVKTTRRLRDDEPIDQLGTTWAKPSGAMPPIPLPSDPYEDDDGDPITAAAVDINVVTPGLIHNGQSLSLGFTLTADAPDTVDVLNDVEEQLMHSTLGELFLPLAFVDRLPPSIIADDDGTVDDDNEVAVCHVPPGNPDQRHLIYVGQSALDAHLAHGDTIGTCAFAPGTLTFELYEATFIDGAEPYGPMLGSVSISTDVLPTANFTWVGMDLDVDNDIDEDDELVPSVIAPNVDVPIDLSPLSAVVEPGRPHTLVMRYAGGGSIAHSRVLTGSAQSDVAVDWPATPTLLGWPVNAAASDGFVPQPMSVPHRYEGNQTYTQTEAHPIVSKVIVTLDMEDGRTVTGSSVLAGQAAVTNPWLGAVADDKPTLHMAGQ